MKHKPKNEMHVSVIKPIRKGELDRVIVLFNQPVHLSSFKAQFGKHVIKDLVFINNYTVTFSLPTASKSKNVLNFKLGEEKIPDVLKTASIIKGLKELTPTPPPEPAGEKDPYRTGPASNWWMKHQDAQHTGDARGVGNLLSDPLWSVIFDRASYASQPIVGNQKLILYNRDYNEQRIVAMNVESGDLIWTVPAHQEGYSWLKGTPLAIDGLVVVMLATHNKNAIAAYDIESGSREWLTEVDAPGHAGLAASFDRVYFSNRSGKLQAFDLNSGEHLWDAPINVGNGSHLSSPAVAFRNVYVGGEDGLYVFDAITGEPSWKVDLPPTTRASPSVVMAVSQGNCAVVLINIELDVNSGRLGAFNAITGQQLWQVNGNASLCWGSPVSDQEGNLYVNIDNQVNALDAVTGNILATSPQYNWITSYLALTRNQVLVPAEEKLIALNKDTLVEEMVVEIVPEGDFARVENISAVGNKVFVTAIKLVEDEIKLVVEAYPAE